MKLFRLASLVFGGTISLVFASAKEGRSNQTVNRRPTQGNADGFQDELKMYLVDIPLRLSRGLDIMEPSSAATAESNKQILLAILGDNEMLEALDGAKRQTCAQLKATACPEYLKSISCDTVNIEELRHSLIEADAQINSAEGAPTPCVDALRLGLTLFDILVIREPLSVYQRDPSAGPRHALNHLFSTLNMASIGGVQQQVQQSAEASRPAASSRILAEEFIEMQMSRKKNSKLSPESPERVASFPGSLDSILRGFPGSYLAFAGTGGPIASLFVNWLAQAFIRFDEFFGEGEGNRRPLAPLQKLLTTGHEYRLTLVYRMCGTVLGSLRKSSKMAPGILALPRDNFKRKSLLVGFSRISCDLMLHAIFALHLAEIHAIEHMNILQQMLPPEELEYSVPLELLAGGRLNFRRLCIGFGARGSADVPLDTPCSYDDTVLARLEARAEKSGSVVTEETSLLESAPSEQEQEVPSRVARKNAEMDFLLLQLRGGNQKAAAHLLGIDSGPWWDLLYMIDSRTSSEIMKNYKQVSALCRKAVKKLGSRVARADEESVLCSSAWQKGLWDKQLHCQPKLVSLQCSALGSFFGIFDNGLIGQIGDLLNSISKEAACGTATGKCPKKAMAKQNPLKTVGKKPTVLSRFLPRGPIGEDIFRIFFLLSGNRWKNSKDFISCSDGVDNIIHSFATLVSERSTSVLFSRWLPRTVRRLIQKQKGRKYSRKHFRFLSSKLPSDFYMKLRSCVSVLVHPAVFVHLNQLAFSGSELSGARSRAGGLSERLDNLIAEVATEGLPQHLKKKLQMGEKTTMKDFNGINFAGVHPPQPKTWQDYLKLELQDSMVKWLKNPTSRERIEHECRGGIGSNVVSLFRDSLDLLNSSDTENIALIGKVVSPRETSVGRPLRLKSLLLKLLRLPAYKTQHHSFVAINVHIPEAQKLVRTLVDVYTQNQGAFENQEVFMTSVIDLFAHYEEKNKGTSSGPLGVPQSVLVPPLHRRYASLQTAYRLKELSDSAMSEFFRHLWTLMFSVSANSILNAGDLDGLEKTFSEEAWRVSINDPFQASSFGMVLMGGDIGLRLFNQMLPTSQKRMLKKAKYGSPTVFTSQMQLTGSLLSASGHLGLGMFLHAQSAYFGLMIKTWIQKRTEDRIREIISWITLGLFFASSLVQVTEGVTEIANTGNETGQASMTTGCPPIGLCIDDSGNAFIGNPTGSPALTALQAVMKTGIMASIAVLAGPLVALYNIAVSHFTILSRLEMALRSTCKQLLSRLARSKTIKNIKELLSTKQDRMQLREAAAAGKSASLGDEVEQSLTAFFQGNEKQRCQQ